MAPRIASLLPGATEIVCALGLAERLVGVSHECDHPPPVQRLPRLTSSRIDSRASSQSIHAQVGGALASGLSLYELDQEALRRAAPDLIVTQDTCPVCAVSTADVQAAAFALCGKPVEIITLAPLRLADVWDDIERIGRAAGTIAAATALRARLEEKLAALAQRPRAVRPRVLMLEWLDPPMVGGHWTPELLEAAGGEALLGHPGEPTRARTWEEIADADPELILCAPCGFPIEQTMRELPRLTAETGFGRVPAVQRGHFQVIDGNAYFNRPGPRLVESAEIAARAIALIAAAAPG
jgi:iron complex transport system substrate-binding protein